MSDKLVRIKNRYDTAVNWETENPVLAAGEIGIDSTNNIIKVGNGKDEWNSLDVLSSVPKSFVITDNSLNLNFMQQLNYNIGNILYDSIVGCKYTLIVDGYMPVHGIIQKPSMDNKNTAQKFYSQVDANKDETDCAVYITTEADRLYINVTLPGVDNIYGLGYDPNTLVDKEFGDRGFILIVSGYIN